MDIIRQNDIITKISQLPRMKLSLDDPNVVYSLESVCPAIVNEVNWLFSIYPYLGIFELGTNQPPFSPNFNAWQISSSFLRGSLADTYMGSLEYDDHSDYMFNYLEFGYSCRNGGVGICKDPLMFGKIAYCTFEAGSERGNIPIIANSFTDWVERTLNHGPNADCFYWELPDFVDLGPAIPDDASYIPLGN